MKRIIFLSVFVIAATSLMAQADVTSAYNSNKSGNYEDAAAYIEKAMSNAKAIAKEKTWRYRAMIYNNIAGDSLLAPKYPDALPKALESIKKAKELDTRNSYKTENDIVLNELAVKAGNTGIGYYNANDFNKAADMFLLSNQIYNEFGLTDTLALYNSALAMQKAERLDEAKDMFLQTAEMGYQAATGYYSAARIARDQENVDEALEILKKGRAAYPNEQSLIIEELNIYLSQGSFEEAEKNLQAAIDKDPDNENMHYALGTVYDNLKKTDKAEAAYKKAIELKPDYFDANYNLGALIYNKAVGQIDLANEIPVNQTTKYNKAIAEAKATFASALPFLEKAYEVSPDDVSTIRSLKEIYYRSDMTEKMVEMQKKLEELGQ